MKQEIRLKNLSSSARVGLEALIASLAREHFQRYLPPFESERAALFATLEKALPGQRFRVTLRLELPGRTLVSREEDQDIGSASEAAFRELEARLRRHLTRLRRQDLDREQSRRQRLPRLEQMLPERPPAEQEAYFDHVKDALSVLTKFVRRELAYLRSSGQLASDYPTVEDVRADRDGVPGSRGCLPPRKTAGSGY